MYLLIAILVIAILYGIYVYNKFQRLDNEIEALYAQIQVAQKKRLDLLISLVENLKSHALFEKSLLQKITELRTLYEQGKALAPKDIVESEKAFLSLWRDIQVQVENYPQLTTQPLVKEVMANIQKIEEEIANLRYTCNAYIKEWNNLKDVFPSNLVASLMEIPSRDREYLSFPEEPIERRPAMLWWEEKKE